MIRSRKGRKERVALDLVAGDPHGSAVGQGGALGDGQADAGAGGWTGDCGGTEITVEDALAIGGGNDGPETMDGEDDFLVRSHRPDGDGAVELGVLDGVVEVLGEKHSDKTPVAIEEQGFIGYFDVEAHARGAIGEAIDGFLDKEMYLSLIHI